MAATSNVGVVVISARGVAGVLGLEVSAVADSTATSVGVGVNVRVGSGVLVGDVVAVGVLGRVGVETGASEVGVEYVPHRDGVCPQELNKRAAMQKTNRVRVTGHPFSELYPAHGQGPLQADGH